MKQAKGRLQPEAWPVVTPSFTIPPGGNIFTLGSCFARNIEDNLATLGYKIPTLELNLPTERPGRITSILNKYTPPAIYQEIAWAHSIYARDDVPTEADSAPLGYRCADGKMIDLHLSAQIPLSPDKFYAQRREIYRIFREVFRADLVTITFGLIESWFDTESKLFIQAAPNAREIRPDRERFTFAQLDYETCLDYAQATIELIRSVNSCAFLITTSPIVLGRTFTDLDILTANLESKSVLRAVCGKLTRLYDRVDYFPSYENATLTRSWSVYEEDLVHVAPAFVAKMVRNLVGSYFPGSSETSRAYHRAYEKKCEGKIDEAIEILAQARPDPSAHPDAVLFWARLLNQTERYPKAVTLLQSFVAVQPRDASAWRSLSQSYLGIGQHEKAWEAAQIAMRLDPDNQYSQRNLAACLVAVSRFEEALAVITSAVDRNEKHSALHFEQANIFLRLGRTQEAEASFRRAVALGSHEARTYASLADLLIADGRQAEAGKIVQIGVSQVRDKTALQEQLAKLEMPSPEAPSTAEKAENRRAAYQI